MAIREQIASADNKLTLTVRSAERSAHGAKGYFNKLLVVNDDGEEILEGVGDHAGADGFSPPCKRSR